ncbi:ABC-type transporter, integral membrane subunit [Deinococcus proteolyticus MRP]|uniref:ABC-type transporter, integral membrane subunit n=1 Tax=Deinococcus proteolyticus (strain ATCC 35074 / DSM 20540 / JCM 6276 / NBRC 101906 / NCIMB 13154 / VKM Ac-1939 / CCM 2703 / MRP) TaxID=693977 RepID=F0RNQ8_DEIPM|nr:MULTISPECIES: metal ABC transporter permease [Deinococcus]ADY25291.1 ABC-type transporter, integral membrane subunit [Deinococcus proteolyticus MRP]MCY1703392.1 metal ABC transporter permease [Deinococcus sp. SL84]
MFDWLTDPLAFGFFVRALAALSLVSVLCAVVGSWVVLRGLSYVGDAMSHAVLPGIVGAFLAGGNVLVGAVLAAVLAALGMNTIQARSGLKQDSATYIVFVGMFALGIVLLSRTPTFTSDLSHFLIGNPLGVTPADLWVTAAAALGVGGLLLGLQKELLLASFDPTEARAIGLPVQRLEQLLLVLIGLVVVLVIGLVGTTLSVSLLITGAAAARLYARSLRQMMLFAALFGVLGGAVGLYLSYYLGTAAGATVVLVNTVMFVLLLACSRELGQTRRG